MNSMHEKKPTKSERTRAQILAAARQLFAQQGYDATTIRDVAAQASIDPAMVIRYFHSKEELFALAATIELKLPPVGAIDPARIGDMLIRRFLEVWEGAPDGRGMAILLRSASSNEFAANKMREVFNAQVRHAVASVGSPANAGLRAGLVSSQLLGLAMCRYILQLPPVVAMSPEEIIRDIGPTLQRYVTGSTG